MGIQGMLLLQITIADPANFLREIQNLSIPVEQVNPVDDLTITLKVPRRFMRTIFRLADKRGGKGKILEYTGLYWKAIGLFKRPVLVLGLMLLLALTIFLPSRLLFFRVAGNVTIPERMIIALANENGLEFGVPRREVRSEKIKNALLKAIPELEWVGINTSGCVATISVRERQQETQLEHPGVSSIVAIRDGIIQEILVTSGSASVKIGETVKAGQVLISGYTDCGLSIRAERATGEIYATTTYKFTLVIPENDLPQDAQTAENKNFFLIFGKNRINFSESSGILDTGCVKMYEEKYVTLPGGFVLPVGIATEYNHCAPTGTSESPEETLRLAAERYLQSLMTAGKILTRDEQIQQENGCWYLEGSYVCLEMIGIEQNEEIIKP